MKILCRTADSVHQELDSGDLEEARAELDTLRELLWGRLQHYQAVLEGHHLELPFSKGITPQPPLEEYDDE